MLKHNSIHNLLLAKYVTQSHVNSLVTVVSWYSFVKISKNPFLVSELTKNENKCNI